jgi:hypothetical protein
VVATGGGGKGQFTGKGAPFQGRMRRWPRPAETVGGAAGRNGGKAVGRQGGGRGPNAISMTSPLLGPCG